MSSPDMQRFFRLKPIQAARVSEISESTAAASVSSEEQINFHIGNPLQDDRLSSAYMRIALGLDVERQDIKDTELDRVMEALGWNMQDKPKLELLVQTIRNSIPYMPRGGYNRTAPHALIQMFSRWLEGQQEPLHYDLGEKTGRREVILASGGVREALRVLLFSLSDYVQAVPARILCHHYMINLPESSFSNLNFIQLEDDEQLAFEQIGMLARQTPENPTFVLLGGLIGEETRRQLRLLSTQVPLFFIEINNAPNHQSLAREAKLTERVIRLLSPAIFDAGFDSLAPVFVVGNADYLKVIENVHFKLKGTPSASEIQLLSFLIKNTQTVSSDHSIDEVMKDLPQDDGGGSILSSENAAFQISQRISKNLERTIDSFAELAGSITSSIEGEIPHFVEILTDRIPIGLQDKLAEYSAYELVDQLIYQHKDSSWRKALKESFLSAFSRHQLQYQPDRCMIVSGSSRTALGILGFNCGITDVVISDLSWSYEQCFPHVYSVPLTETFELDVESLIDQVERLCADDPTWPEHGAVVINNPHNATGRVFEEADLRKLIAYCLQQKIYVIDDLAYQNVAPADGMIQIKSVRQIANELVRSGKVSASRIDRVITVHAMSKTDCLAGARIAVIEILNDELGDRFKKVNDEILPNLAAIFICYLFYRGTLNDTQAYWGLRNRLFQDRTRALMAAIKQLPDDRNPYQLKIIPPSGSMYPLLVINRLPDGLSLDWLASTLARKGIGLLPLSTFARTEQGFETGRRAFRLTLGGPDNAEILLAKTRRLLIDLNRIIAEEESHYNRKELKIITNPKFSDYSASRSLIWEKASNRIRQYLAELQGIAKYKSFRALDDQRLQEQFSNDYLPERLKVFHDRLIERAGMSDEMMLRATGDDGSWLGNRLEKEFMKDSLIRRQESFRLRSFDRTVHPTQRYSIQSEIAFDAIVDGIISNQVPENSLVEVAADELLQEYLGLNVPIHSQNEPDEILLDVRSMICAENYAELYGSTPISSFLSFWSDWDGSNRPSGQGQVLAARLVMENVRQMAEIINLVRQASPQVVLPSQLLSELEALPEKSKRFSQLLRNITQLTQQLEERYRGILPLSIGADGYQKWTTRLHLRRDPIKTLWRHNDRYEQKMLELRHQRREMLDSYFSLNKRLRKQLYALIPVIKENIHHKELARAVVGYRDILQRTAITPRIHQATIIERDQFAIDTTVFNIQEINQVSGKYGNPGMTLGLQISFSSEASALISLDRKLGIQAESVKREDQAAELPPIWLIPLFEDRETVDGIPGYLDKVWEYATQSRRGDQSPGTRFKEMLTEVFIAGSDLSQQVSQASGAYEYLKAKHSIYTWLAEREVAETVRIKLGSGEAMQRQGGYYSSVAGRKAFPRYKTQKSRFAKYLPEAAQKSASYAVTPLQGVFMGGDLRTFQSCLAEQLRYLPVGEYANLLFHVHQTQEAYRKELIRAVETITESRLGMQSRNKQELERLTFGTKDPVYDSFLVELTRHFRHILYGREEDVVGIHIISYFIARSMPQLRDRPSSRPRQFSGSDRNQKYLAYIANIIPLTTHGSLLRAIAHNQAQSAVLGINQLTTGLFRAIDYYLQSSQPGASNENALAERILPNLPVYEILNTIRLYHDRSGETLKHLGNAIPAGNSAMVALREDIDAIKRYLPLFQNELLRRHGLDANEFIADGMFIQELLPTLRPDLAVLLQADLLNTDPEHFVKLARGNQDQEWLSQVSKILGIPQQIEAWRRIIWDVLGDSIYQRVQSFTELASALYSFSSVQSFSTSTINPVNRPKLSPALTDFLRASPADDEMRQFLASAVGYLNSFSEGTIEIPVSIIHALNDVERIAMIEESSLPAEKQDTVRFAALQIARLAGDNG